MCVVLYFGSDARVPTSEWSDVDPRFRALDLSGTEQRLVRPHLSKRHIYYLASHERCGCGFEWDADRDETEIAEWDKEWETLSAELREEIRWSPSDAREKYRVRRQDSEDLVRLLKQILEETDEVEIYVCTDPEYVKPTSRAVMSPDKVIGKRFALYDEALEASGQAILYTIVKERPQR